MKAKVIVLRKNSSIFDLMDVNIEPSWKEQLQSEFNEPYFERLTESVRAEFRAATVYPPGKQIFNAFDRCPLDRVKVVIIGQDPYHGPGQANGLCFSVNKGIPHPPSLVNIFKEIESDLGIPYPVSGDLTKWAEQGVLLLNASLTVRRGEANSHQNLGWQQFTDAAIKAVSDHCNGVVFLLWGGFAKRKINLIDQKKHHILTSGHPSPLSANKGHWFGNKHFSKTNRLLEEQGGTPIDWRVE